MAPAAPGEPLNKSLPAGKFYSCCRRLASLIRLFSTFAWPVTADPELPHVHRREWASGHRFGHAGDRKALSMSGGRGSRCPNRKMPAINAKASWHGIAARGGPGAASDTTNLRRLARSAQPLPVPRNETARVDALQLPHNAGLAVLATPSIDRAVPGGESRNEIGRWTSAAPLDRTRTWGSAGVRCTAGEVRPGRADQHMAIRAAEYGRRDRDLDGHARAEHGIDRRDEAFGDRSRRVVGADPGTYGGRPFGAGERYCEGRKGNRDWRQDDNSTHALRRSKPESSSF